MVNSLVCTKCFAVYVKLSVVAYHEGCWSLTLYNLYGSPADIKKTGLQGTGQTTQFDIIHKLITENHDNILSSGS
jgi:hypothetical protein